MISIIYVFWMYVILFAIIGMLRGWAKELLVGFAVVVAVALNFLLHTYAPMVNKLPEGDLTLVLGPDHRARRNDLLWIPDRHQRGSLAGWSTP